MVDEMDEKQTQELWKQAMTGKPFGTMTGTRLGQGYILEFLNDHLTLAMVIENLKIFGDYSHYQQDVKWTGELDLIRSRFLVGQFGHNVTWNLNGQPFDPATMDASPQQCLAAGTRVLTTAFPLIQDDQNNVIVKAVVWH